MKISLSKKTLTLAALTAVVLVGGFFTYRHFTNTSSIEDIPERPIGSKETIEYVPATEEEKEFSDSKKDELIAQQKKDAEDAARGTKKNIPPIITNATQSTTNDLTITAYMPGIAEETGNCVLVLSKDSKKITKSTPGFANVSNTNCEPFTIPKSELSEKGTWTAVVSYASANTAGVSQPKKVEIR